MAFEVKKPELDEEGKDTTGVEAPLVVGSAPGATMTAGADTGNIQQKTQDAPTAGAGMTDINKYLDANRQKIQDLSKNVSGVIRGDTEAARKSLTGAQTQFQTDVAGGTVNLDQPTFNTARQSLTDEGTYKAGNAQSFLGDQAAVDRFKKMYGATYSGPEDIASQSYYNPAYTESQKAIRSAGLVNNETGLKELIARSRPNESGRYSAGVLGLDAALLGGDKEALAQIKAAAGESDITDRLAALKELAKSEVLKGRETTAATKAAMQKEFNVGTEEQQIADYAATLKDKAMKDYMAKLEEVRKIAPEEGKIAENYFSLDPVQNIDKYGVATAEDYARLKALEDLTGVTGTMTQYANKAGTANQYLDPSGAFNAEKYKADVEATRKQRLEQERLMAEYKAAQEKAAAEAEARQKELERQQTGTQIGVVAGASIGGAAFGPVGAVVGGAIGGAIGGALCFDPDSEFEMNDGTHSKIGDIKLGDVLKEGGKVYSISKHILNEPLFSYPTNEEDCYVWVTGSHAVKEDGIWKRILNSRVASVINEHEIEYVISLSCENHIMISHGVVFADFDEVDNSQGLTDQQCLNILNGCANV